MHKWLFWIGLLGLTFGLVACGGDNAKEQAAEPAANATAEVEAEATEFVFVAPDDLKGQQMVPGIQTRDGLEVRSSRSYVTDNGIGWVVLEVVNPTEQPIYNIAALVSLLDTENYEWDTQRIITPFINLPPNYPIPMVLSFAATNYTFGNFVALVETEEYDTQNPFVGLQGEYDLPVTINEAPTDGFPLTITGTITNDRGQALIAPTAVVGVYGADGQILGVALPQISGLNEAGEWADGAELIFSATFIYLPETIETIRVANAGYRAE